MIYHDRQEIASLKSAIGQQTELIVQLKADVSDLRAELSTVWDRLVADKPVDTVQIPPGIAAGFASSQISNGDVVKDEIVFERITEPMDSSEWPDWFVEYCREISDAILHTYDCWLKEIWKEMIE